MADLAPILHIAPATAVAAAQRRFANDPAATYVDPSLDAEGFIHCSTVEQVLIPANERFHGRNDLVLLEIDVAAVPDPVVYEDCYDSGHAFPHIYGPIPIAAVTRVVAFPTEPDGSFVLPAEFATA